MVIKQVTEQASPLRLVMRERERERERMRIRQGLEIK